MKAAPGSGQNLGQGGSRQLQPAQAALAALLAAGGKSFIPKGTSERCSTLQKQLDLSVPPFFYLQMG